MLGLRFFFFSFIFSFSLCLPLLPFLLRVDADAPHSSSAYVAHEREKTPTGERVHLFQKTFALFFSRRLALNCARPRYEALVGSWCLLDNENLHADI